MVQHEVENNKWQKAQFFGTQYGMEEANVMLKVLANSAPTNNKIVRNFEKEFAQYVGGQYGLAANSWVGAAHLLAISLNIQKGDEFIVPALTFQGSANIFLREGAKIVFADIDPRTFNLDATKLEEKITERTKAIIVVHLCGQPADMDAIMDIAKRHNLLIIQDAAHAPGALYKRKKLAELGDYVIYSFHQAKNMSTLGEGGMLVTNHDQYIDSMKAIRAHGGELYCGISSRMIDLQGAVGLEQLKKLQYHNEHRRKLAYHLNSRLSCIEGFLTPKEIDNVYHTYHIYNAIIEPEILGLSRNDLIRKLWTKYRIMASTQYYPTVNCLPAYKKLGYGEGDCPIAEDTASKIISLPISPSLDIKDMDELVDAIISIIKNK